MSTDVAVAIAPELDATNVVQKKKKNARPSAKRSSTGSKRPPARPYRKISKETLDSRMAKLTTRVQKAKRQHDAAQALLAKYSQESYYREKDQMQQQAEEPADQEKAT